MDALQRGPQKGKLADLDVLCLDNIFKFLTPNDLAVMSLTCSKYKYLAENFFDLHCTTRPIRIFPRNDIIFQIHSLYEKCFHSLIRHIDATHKCTEWW